MAGSPKKRAAREAAEREKNLAAGRAQVADEVSGESASASQAAPASPTLPAVTPIQGEVLPPEGAQEPTRTALKRAMRARAQEHAEAAIAVLVANLKSPDAKLAHTAANDILAWGFGKPATEIEAGGGAAMIIVKKFFGENDG